MTRDALPCTRARDRWMDHSAERCSGVAIPSCACRSFRARRNSSTCSSRMRGTSWPRLGCSSSSSEVLRRARAAGEPADRRGARGRRDQPRHRPQLEKTFVTPFDREDIHELISRLDDILDFIEEVADTCILYKIDEPTPIAACSRPRSSSSSARRSPQALQKLQGLQGRGAALDRGPSARERGGPHRPPGHRRAVHATATTPIEIIKWKDVYAILEETIDSCEDVANVIERIVVKHA